MMPGAEWPATPRRPAEATSGKAQTATRRPNNVKRRSAVDPRKRSNLLPVTAPRTATNFPVSLAPARVSARAASLRCYYYVGRL